MGEPRNLCDWRAHTKGKVIENCWGLMPFLAGVWTMFFFLYLASWDVTCQPSSMLFPQFFGYTLHPELHIYVISTMFDALRKLLVGPCRSKKNTGPPILHG